MKRRPSTWRTPLALISLVGLTVGLGACGTDDSRDPGTAAGNREGTPSVARQATIQDFDRDGFTNPTRIVNKWLPLSPGTQYTWVGRADRGSGRRAHRVVFTVTDLTKEIDGVRTLVLWDRDYNAGRLQEGELTFHAQDDEGNVWNFGEYPEQYQGGRFTGAPDTWLAGVAEARAGIVMRANPRTGTSSYLQGWAPEIDFADRAKVLKAGLKDCVPLDCYRDVLITDEWTPDEPGAHQRKYYAPGVGNIRVGPAGGHEAEALVLVKVARLGPKALARVRRGALKLERRAYVARKDLYGKTPPAQPLRAE